MRTRHLFLSFLAVVLSAILLTSLLPAAAWGDEAQSAVESTDNADANNSAITDSDDADDSTITEDDDNGDPADDPAEVDADVDLDIEDNTSDEEFSFIPTTSATLTMVNQTYEKIVLESYLTNKEKTKETVKPCDIIFVMDQSKWMNTVEDAGASREAIISELHELLTSLAAPTEGEHRVAIAGYGRVNLGAVDPYDADIYPGVTATGNNISFNTGYYTADGFVSQNGWSDLSASQMSGTGLPQMPESYQSNMTYDNAFLSLDEAEEVLNPDTMQAWYSGASRMDAGLTITEQLAAIANENDPDGDRNLIVCIFASSLPIQNTAYTNASTIRQAAVLEASNTLKEEGATIFSFGDYHPSGKTISGSVQDTEETFNSTMSQVCSKPEYFYSFSNFSSVSDALNRMITQISIIVADEAEQPYTVEAQDMTVVGGDTEQTVSWQDILDRYSGNSADLIAKSVAKVEYYTFTGYSQDGTPLFDSTPYSSTEIPLSDIAKDDRLSYETTLIPIPSLLEASQTDDEHVRYGNKIVITIAAPITVTYEWASDEANYAPSNAILPDPETIVRGTTHNAATVETTDNNFDEHYVFDGWYTDRACTNEFIDDTVVDADITLYGKWTRYVLLDYYWNFWETGYSYPDDNAKFEYNEQSQVYTPAALPGYTFGGWYWDKDLTTPYDPVRMTEDLSLYAKWIPNDDTVYQIRYFQQNISDDDYTEVTADAQTLTGTTDSAIAAITKEYTGFTRDHITYEDSRHTTQTEALPICSDGSLVVKVYYNRNTYRVTYDGNGADGGTVPTDDTAYRYNATVTTAQPNSLTRTDYAFTHWNTAADGSGTSYDAGSTFSITEDTTLYAQWTPITWKLQLTKQSDHGDRLADVRFALYTKNADLAPPSDTAIPNSSGAKRSLTVDGTTWYLLEVRLTDDSGQIAWNRLTEDSYYLLELEAPEGYALTEDSSQTIAAQYGGVREVTVVNAEAYSLPESGGIGTRPFRLLGIALLCTGALVLRRRASGKTP